MILFFDGGPETLITLIGILDFLMDSKRAFIISKLSIYPQRKIEQ